MDNMHFADFLRERRRKCGLTQAQLGALAGVSDKAVSKWENGTARPQSRILARVCEILDISADELLSGRYHFDQEYIQGGSIMKKKIWKSVYQRAHALYGDCLPLEVGSRLLTEEKLMESNDIILHLDALAAVLAEAKRLHEPAEVRNGIGSLFAAWLMEVSEFNPLGAHYHCPQCRRAEFVRCGEDGWDLPAKRCSCGSEMRGDGHQIPIEDNRWEGQFYDLSVTPEFFDRAKQVIREYFHQEKVIEIGQGETSTWLCILPKGTPDNPGWDSMDIYQRCYSLNQYPRFVVCQSPTMARRRALEQSTGTSVSRIDWLADAVREYLLAGDADEVSWVGSDFWKPVRELLRPSSWRALMWMAGISDGWHETAELLRQGIPFSRLPNTRGDLFLAIQKKLMEQGISDSGLARELVRKAGRGQGKKPFSAELRAQLLQLGLEEWLVDDVEKAWFGHKDNSLTKVKYAAVRAWYHLHYPDVLEQVLKEEKNRSC